MKTTINKFLDDIEDFISRVYDANENTLAVASIHHLAAWLACEGMEVACLLCDARHDDNPTDWSKELKRLAGNNYKKDISDGLYSQLLKAANHIKQIALVTNAYDQEIDDDSEQAVNQAINAIAFTKGASPYTLAQKYIREAACKCVKIGRTSNGNMNVLLFVVSYTIEAMKSLQYHFEYKNGFNSGSATKKTEFRRLIKCEDKDRLLEELHKRIGEKTSPSDVGTLLYSALLNKLISRIPSETQFREEFADWKNGSWNTVRQYYGAKNTMTDSEIRSLLADFA